MLAFGRFDPNVGIPPDIDLAFEDKSGQYISRRHASVSGRSGRHTIEDLGSKSGIFLNGTRIGYGPSRELEEGDSIRLGNITMTYGRVPPAVFQKARSSLVRHVLRVTPTDRKVTIKPPKSLVVGRTDARVNFVPDVDLSRDGDVTRLVSRRHALIQWRNGQPYLEDLGSGFGTRVRGELLALGQSIPLLPGDNIWLAGCVLAYDIET
jgi:pSer/pThr/pTyr-binding forkhead associated (FHA) protein